MKTEMKMVLVAGAALAAITVVALFIVPKPASTDGTTPVASSGNERQSTGLTDPTPADSTRVTPATQPAGEVFTPADLITPSTQPSISFSGPSTQPGIALAPPASTPFTPSTQPSATPGGTRGDNGAPVAPSASSNADWNALLAGASSVPVTPGGNGSASATPSNSGTPGLLPPTAGPRGNTPGSNLVPPAARNPAGSAGSSSETSSASTYTVKKGDTLSSISATVYGTPNLWSKIAQANPSVNPNRLKTGTVLTIPARNNTTPSNSVASTPTVPNDNVGGSSLVRDPRTEYQVQTGDSLHKIAQRLYGNANRWEEIYNLNKAAIGNNPTRIKVGQILKLPAPPTRLATQP